MNTTFPPPDSSTCVPPRAERATPTVTRPPFERPRTGRRIAGVCAAVANRFDLDVTTVRLVAVLSILLPGPQVLAYLIAWLVLPNED